jgi:hypothetical protein
LAESLGVIQKTSALILSAIETEQAEAEKAEEPIEAPMALAKAS